MSHLHMTISSIEVSTFLMPSNIFLIVLWYDDYYKNYYYKNHAINQENMEANKLENFGEIFFSSVTNA